MLNKPAYFDRIKVRIGFKDITGSSLGLEDVEELLAGINSHFCAYFINQISLIVSNELKHSSEAFLREVYLEPDLKKKAQHFENSKQKETMVFSKLGLLVISQIARKACDNKKEHSHEDRFKLGKAILILNDLISIASFNSPNAEGALDWNSFAVFTTREALINEEPIMRQAIPRSLLIYRTLRDKVPPEDRLDLDAEFKLNFGFTLLEYFDVLFFIFSKWANSKIPTLDELEQNEVFTSTVLEPNKFFSEFKNKNKNKVIQILDFMAQDFSKTVNVPEVGYSKEWVQFCYNHVSLKTKPLLRQDTWYSIVWKGFLNEKFWNGPYYELLGIYSKQGASGEVKKGNLFRYIGRAMEHYCKGIGKASFGRLFREIDILPSTGTLGDFVIQSSPNKMYIFEVKSSRPTLNLHTLSSSIGDSSDLKKVFQEDLKQVYERIEEYKIELVKSKKQIPKFYPIIIYGQGYPLMPEIWKAFIDEIGDSFIKVDEKIKFPQILSIEDFEILSAVHKNGFHITDIFNLKYKHWERIDFSSFLYNMKRLPRVETRNFILTDILDEYFKSMVTNYFPGQGHRIEESKEFEVPWREIFNLEPNVKFE